jgi:hypothetical protein
MSGLLRSVLHRTFGSDFFARALISQGEELLDPAKLELWDQVLARRREHSKVMHTPISGAQNLDLASKRRVEMEHLALLRQEMQHRGLLRPVAQEMQAADGTWWCRHGLQGGGVACARCLLTNCPQCQEFNAHLCRNAGQCQKRQPHMHVGTAAMREFQDRQMALALEPAKARARKAKATYASRLSQLQHYELEQWYEQRATACDELTRALGAGQLADGSWITARVPISGAAVELGLRLDAAEATMPWMHTGFGCIGQPTPRARREGAQTCGWRDDLAECRWCYAHLCEWHRTAPYQPRGERLQTRYGGVVCQCADHVSCRQRQDSIRNRA